MTAPSPAAPSQAVAGSFRDPAGYVFAREGRIFRAVCEDGYQVLRRLVDDGLLSELIQRQMLVRSELVEEEVLRQTLAAEHPGFAHFVEHEAIWPITYPYEWTISMLADAAVHTLDLQLCLLQRGHSLKDATAYNVQFVAGRPKFIDLGSIQRPARLDVWFALGQFSQMFTFPLLLCRRHGWDLRSYFLANLGGRDVEQMYRGLGWWQRFQPGMLLDVTLPALLGRWANRRGGTRRDLLEKSSDNAAAQVANLRRLRAKVRRLAAGYRPRGLWAEYARDCHYGDTAEVAKKELVARFLESTRPRRVLDLGCNTGDYSRLAAASGAAVVAVDTDHDAVELLYRQLRQSPAAISPMVVDLCNPSPGIGYLNRERAPFLERASADCVLALALVHHLLVAGNLAPPAIRDLLYTLTARDLVLEFVPREDPMFARLMQFRVDLYGDWTLPRCREVFQERFELLHEFPIPDSGRTLLCLRKRTP